MFVSVTRLRARAWRSLVPFLVHAVLAARQARRADGNVATDLLGDLHFAFWTRSVWRDERLRVLLPVRLYRVYTSQPTPWQAWVTDQEYPEDARRLTGAQRERCVVGST